MREFLGIVEQQSLECKLMNRLDGQAIVKSFSCLVREVMKVCTRISAPLIFKVEGKTFA